MKYCDCKDVCPRWGVYDDGSGGWFCPYDPYSDLVCKKTDETGKDIKPTIRKKVELNDARTD